jgi:hypothetical protein
LTQKLVSDGIKKNYSEGNLITHIAAGNLLNEFKETGSQSCHPGTFEEVHVFTAKVYG